ncbi:hypothetical protein FACS189419_07390 [Planctomycetales bacterium]|nr:hypothetical protein FACS189419_07390 [Planctomycetales bacterium]
MVDDLFFTVAHFQVTVIPNLYFREKIMTNKLRVVLYVTSIVVAVGIGMFNTSAREGCIDNGGGGTGYIDTPTCAKRAISLDPYNSTANKLVGTTGAGASYRAASGSTTYCEVPTCVSQSHGNFEYDAD